MGKVGSHKSEWLRNQTRTLLPSPTADTLTAFALTVFSVMTSREPISIDDVKAIIEAELSQSASDQAIAALIQKCKPKFIPGNRCQSCGGGITSKPLTANGTPICRTPEAHEVKDGVC